jgi:hypothetical protein
MASKTEKKHQIGNLAIVILTILATVADLLSLIPFVGDFVGPIFWIFAGIYFWKSGMGLVNGKRLAASLISLVAEMIPGVQELPTIIAGMIIIIVVTRLEDKTDIKLPATGTASARTPLNAGEVRMPTPQAKDNHIVPAASNMLNFNGVRRPSS